MPDFNGSYYADSATLASVATISAAMAQAESDRFNAVLGVRNYWWANAAARTAATGMRKGDFGYQDDTDITYRYSGSAWVAWDSGVFTHTPTLTPGSGAFTTTTKTTTWRYSSGVVIFHIAVTVNNAGTAAGGLTISLPFTAVGGNAYGRESGVTGLTLSGQLDGASCIPWTYNNAAVSVATGSVITLTGIARV